MKRSYPLYRTRKIHCLDGVWDFVFSENKVSGLSSIRYDNKMAVPGVFDAYPDYLGKRGFGVFRTFIEVTPGTAGLLEFGGLSISGDIYVDGKLVGGCHLPYSGFRLEVAPSQNMVREVVVVIDNRFDYDENPLFEQFFDFYAYGGILRSAYWHELPGEYYFDRARITVTDFTAREFSVEISLGGALPPAGSLAFILNGKAVTPLEIKPDGAKILATFREPSLLPWSPENPALSLLEIKAPNGDSITERFGMRIIKVEGKEIQLNGKALKLLGFCRHESNPQFGPALPQAQLIQDLQLLKKMSCNFVRGSHYPQDQRFLDLCDELGFLVFEESLGWGQHTDKYAAQKFIDLQVAQTRRMVENSYNHPAVIMWGFLNEGGSKNPALAELYKTLFKTVRAADSSRPVSYASMFPKDDLYFSECDIICINTYPGWYSDDRETTRPLEEIPARFDKLIKHLADTGQGHKPFIISEIGAGAIYGWRDPSGFHWSEEYQRDYLETACRYIIDSPEINGVSLWQFCDGRTYSCGYALGRPRAFNNKGVVDEYRRPKMAFYKVAELFAAAAH